MSSVMNAGCFLGLIPLMTEIIVCVTSHAITHEPINIHDIFPFLKDANINDFNKQEINAIRNNRFVKSVYYRFAICI